MVVPTSEVGYTPAMARREDHEVHKDMWWQWTHKNIEIGGGKANTTCGYFIANELYTH